MEIITVTCRHRGRIEGVKSFKDGDKKGEDAALHFFADSLIEYYPGLTKEEAMEHALSGSYAFGNVSIETIHSNLVGVDE